MKTLSRACLFFLYILIFQGFLPNHLPSIKETAGAPGVFLSGAEAKREPIHSSSDLYKTQQYIIFPLPKKKNKIKN